MRCKLDYTVDDFIDMLIEINNYQLSYTLEHSKELINTIYSPVGDNAINLKIAFDHFDNNRFNYYKELIKYHEPLPYSKVYYIVINLLPINDLRAFFFFFIKSFVRFNSNKKKFLTETLNLEHQPLNSDELLSTYSHYATFGFEHRTLRTLKIIQTPNDLDEKSNRLLLAIFIRKCEELVDELIFDDIFFNHLETVLNNQTFPSNFK